MRHLLLVIICLALGCDAALTPYEDGIVEGTYVLPDGRSVEFSSRASAQAFRHRGLGSYDVFQFGTAYIPEGVGPLPSVRIAQSGLQPVSGTFTASFVPESSLPRIGASFSIFDVEGFEDVLPHFSPNDIQVFYNTQGTVTIDVEGDRIRGTFDLYGAPDGLADSVRVYMRGRFDTPWLEAPPR